jgi:hypothetical protein
MSFGPLCQDRQITAGTVGGDAEPKRVHFHRYKLLDAPFSARMPPNGVYADLFSVLAMNSPNRRIEAQVNTDHLLLVRLRVPSRRRKVKVQLFLKIPACSLQKFGANLLKHAKPSNTKVEPILRRDSRDRVASTCDRQHGSCNRSVLGARRLGHLAHQVTEGRTKNRCEYLFEVRMIERVYSRRFQSRCRRRSIPPGRLENTEHLHGQSNRTRGRGQLWSRRPQCDSNRSLTPTLPPAFPASVRSGPSALRNRDSPRESKVEQKRLWAEACRCRALLNYEVWVSRCFCRLACERSETAAPPRL